MRTGGKLMVAALTLGVALTSAPGTAHAWSCVSGYWRLPRAGAVDVPTDAVLWGHVARYTQLLGPSGEVVDVDERQLAIGGIGIDAERDSLPVLVPRAELQPNAEYTILSDQPSSGERLGFRTASGPATAAVPLPTLIATETGSGESWLGSLARHQSLEFEAFAEGQLALLGDIADAADGDALDGLVSLRELLTAPTETSGPMIDWLSEDSTLSVGVSDCTSWPPGAADRQDARFGAIDLAGNFSGWVDIPLELPSLEEAQANIERRDAERAEAVRQHIQEPRSAIANCSTAAGLGTRSAAGATWLSLSLGLLAASVRRRARR